MTGLLAQAVDQYGGPSATDLPNTGFPLLPVLIIGLVFLIIGVITNSKNVK